MTVCVHDGVAIALARLGVRCAFGVVGSGNFHFTNTLVSQGVRFIAARHEGGAATMADAYSRMSGEVSVVSLHQGCGLTNAITGIGEAAKSRTPLLIVAGEATDKTSNFHMDQDALVRSVGASSVRLRSAETAVEDTRAAYELALRERRTVLLNLPVELQTEMMSEGQLKAIAPVMRPQHAAAAAGDVETLADLLTQAKRPVFIAGRGSRSPGARDGLVWLGDTVGALLAEGAVAKGLFEGQPWSIGVSGGFSSPLTARLIADADLIVGWGTTLNMWTTAHDQLLGKGVKLVQVDLESDALGRNRSIDLGVVGDVAKTARAVAEFLRVKGARRAGYRTEQVAEKLGSQRFWRAVPFEDMSTQTLIDPRTLSIALDDLLPQNRILSVDSGNFMGYPSMYLKVPDENGFCFTQAFQSIGIGLSTGIGAALARPDRFAVVACGDGGFLMGVSELETAVRLQLKMLIVVYNDQAYGAEVYQFKPQGHSTATVEFPDTDIAELARGYGADAMTMRGLKDVESLANRLKRGLDRPLVVDAKVVGMRAWWVGKRSALQPEEVD